MKKLIVMLAAVGLAVGAQAASYNWKTSSNMQGVNATAVTDNGDYAAGTTNMKGQGTWSVILALYESGTYGTGSENLIGTSASTGINFSSTGSKANTGNIEVGAAVAGTTYDYVLTITGTQNNLTSRGVDGAYDYSGATLSTTINGTITTAAMGSTTLSSGIPTTWTVSGITPVGGGGVPEPTSGLLLLVGASLLGLRRKRA